jgi:CRISPR/Cas system-associated endonuclease Cas1
VDRLVLTVLNRKQFAHEDFEKGEGDALYLVSAAARRFLAEYERWMLHEPVDVNRKGFRGALRDSVRSYAAALRDSETSRYEPFLFEPQTPEGAH